MLKREDKEIKLELSMMMEMIMSHCLESKLKVVMSELKGVDNIYKMVEMD